ncbi:MAG: flavin reductase [Muribaculaceae bacterium]|nr:flavin reductase [Muribaculaceae bacterium]
MKNFKPKAWMLPQPVLIIGTYDSDGTPNAMNAAWSGQWDMNEIMISMGSHATTENLKRCADFTVAFATVDTMTEADYVGIVSGKTHHDKIKNTGWKAVKGENVNAPVFNVFPMTMECRVKEKLNESETGCYIIAEIINIVCDEAFIAADGKPDVEKMNLITFDPIHNGYIALGARIGNAFHDGQKLKNDKD